MTFSFIRVSRGICNHLRQLGHDEVVYAATAEEALGHLEKKNFDIVVAGWDLPDQAGLTLVETIRDRWVLPTLMVSPHDDPMRVMLAVQAGVDGYLLRPLNLQALASNIRRISARRNGEAAASPAA